jgi:hypothetical protein
MNSRRRVLALFHLHYGLEKRLSGVPGESEASFSASVLMILIMFDLAFLATSHDC